MLRESEKFALFRLRFFKKEKLASYKMEGGEMFKIEREYWHLVWGLMRKKRFNEICWMIYNVNIFLGTINTWGCNLVHELRTETLF